MPTAENLPPALFKATQDQSFQYALALRNGMVIEFSGAEVIDDHWVALQSPEIKGFEDFLKNSGRNLEVRISEIAWVIDAPHGT